MDINLTDVWTDVNCKAIILVKNLIHAVFSKQRQTVSLVDTTEIVRKYFTLLFTRAAQ